MSQTTPLSALLGDEESHMPEPPRQQQNPQQSMPDRDPSAQFAQLPDSRKLDTRPITNQMPVGPSQGLSAPEGSYRREYFGLADIDYRSAILVFAIVLILSTGIISSLMKSYIPGTVGPDNRNLILGSILIAFIATLLYVVIKFFGKL